MDITRFIIFFSVLSVIYISIEAYTLFNWKKYVKRYNLSLKWYKIPLIISIVSLAITILSIFGNLLIGFQNQVRYITMFVLAIWIIPKLAIVPILLIKDISRLFLKLVRKISKKDSKNIDSSKRKLIETTGWSLASIPFIIVSKGLFSTTYNFTVHNAEVYLDKLDSQFNGFKIVQLSDLHLGSFYDDSSIQEVRRIVNGLNPDLIVVTGDFVNNDPDELKIGFNELRKLNSTFGVYSCLGNHDHYMKDYQHKKLLKGLNDANMNVMLNENKQFNIDGGRFNLIGIDNIGMRQKFGDLDKAFKGLNSERANILLCHDPTNWDKNIRNKYPADLTLSGHTHGGQVAWDFNGIELKPAKFVYNQTEGLYKNADHQLYINRGVGTVGPPLRIGVEPEITEIILKS